MKTPITIAVLLMVGVGCMAQQDSVKTIEIEGELATFFADTTYQVLIPFLDKEVGQEIRDYLTLNYPEYQLQSYWKNPTYVIGLIPCIFFEDARELAVEMQTVYPATYFDYCRE